MPISYASARQFITRAGIRGGIKFPKGAKARLLRASRVTNWLKEGKNETAIKKTTFGKPTSKMLAHYEKLAGGDIEQLLYPDAPRKSPAKPRDPVKSETCTCGEPCPPKARFCPSCGIPIRKEGA